MAHTIAQNVLPTPNNMDLGALITLTADGVGTVDSMSQENAGCRGVVIGVNITAISGTTPTLTVNIYGFDNASGQKYLILASTAKNATGFFTLTVYPGLTAAANSVASTFLPTKWLVETVVGGTGPSVTATVGASVVY